MIERLERNRGIEAIAELGSEQSFYFDHFIARLLGVGEPHARFLNRFLAGVGRHDDQRVAEIGLATVIVGQRAMIHDLQQDVVDVRMRLFNFVEQQHAVGFLGDRFGQLPALIETDITRRRANQPRDRVALHVFRHVEANQLVAQAVGELPRDFGFADAGRAGEKEAANRLGRIAEARARHFDGFGQRIDRHFLSEDDSFQIAVEVFQCATVVRRNVRRWDSRDFGDDFFNILLADQLLLPRFWQDALRRTGFVDDVDRFVWQVTVGNEAH